MPDNQHSRGRGLLGEIDDVRNLPGFGKCPDDPDGLGGDGLLCLLGGRTDVMRANDIGKRKDGVRHQALRRCRLAGVHIQPHAQSLLLDRLGKRDVVEDLAPRRVDQHGALPRMSQEFGIDELARFFRQREMNAHNVGARQHLLWARHDLDTQLIDRRASVPPRWS